jgi:glycosyltransferase involved in cell wall biosynthesis
MVSKSLSVVMPVFNVAPYIEEALQSIIQQHYDPLELIVVDDGSTDTTSSIVESYRHQFGDGLKHIYQDNSGVSRARNVGLMHARGELIAFLDGDDVWPKNVLTRHCNLLEANPHADGVMGRVASFKDRSVPFEALAPEEFSDPYFIGQVGTALVHSRVLDIVGNFDESLSTGEDGDWFLRIKQKGLPIARIDDLSLYYRLRRDSLMRTETVSQNELVLKILKKSVERHRRTQTAETGAQPR